MAVGKPTVFVNVSGSCVSLIDQDARCDAVLQCFYPGAEGGNALANILFGKTSPSGRLPVTFYRDTEDLPPFRDYSMENRTYKFFKGTPLYPFGYGLTYGDVEEKWLSDTEVEVTNRGGMDTDYAVLRMRTEPHPELLDFKKIHIAVGETKTVKFE
jgi:beta-glucosidase